MNTFKDTRPDGTATENLRWPGPRAATERAGDGLVRAGTLGPEIDFLVPFGLGPKSAASYPDAGLPSHAGSGSVP